MGPRLLTRHSLRECLKLLGFYLGCYLVLISIAVTAPLIRGGAPLVDVLAFLPDQMALPGTLALPLAMVTALLGVVGRMREDGELIALQAAGVSTLRVALALLPVAILTAVLVGILAHQVLPDAFRRWREGKSSLLRQAVTTKVMRKEFIYHDEGTSLTANDVDGDRLLGLFVRHRTDDGGVVVLYAPSARWVAHRDEGLDETALHLEFRDARLLGLPGEDGAQETTAGSFPRMVVHLTHDRVGWESKADTKSNRELTRAIDTYSTAVELLATSDDRTAYLHRVLELEPEPLEVADIKHWWRLLRDVAAGESSVLAALPEDLRRRCAEAASEPDPAQREDLCRAFRDAFPHIVDDPIVRAELAAPLESCPDRPGCRDTLARMLFDRALSDHLEPAPLSNVIRESVDRWHYRDDQFERILGEKLRDELREHQMSWHLRWLLACLPLAYWAFACGLALTLPTGNRLLAACIGLATVLVTVLPGVGLTKTVEGDLPVNPGVLMWPVWALLALVGGVLLWRRR